MKVPHLKLFLRKKSIQTTSSFKFFHTEAHQKFTPHVIHRMYTVELRLDKKGREQNCLEFHQD